MEKNYKQAISSEYEVDMSRQNAGSSLRHAKDIIKDRNDATAAAAAAAAAAAPPHLKHARIIAQCSQRTNGVSVSLKLNC
jgi:hypothetical protein